MRKIKKDDFVTLRLCEGENLGRGEDEKLGR